MTSLESLLSERLAAGFTAAGAPGADPVVRRSQRADFQADGALAAAKRLGTRPRELAAAIVAGAQLDDLCERVEIAGPGFLNLTLRADVLSRLATAMAADERAGVPLAARPERVVVDYSSPNVAKEMHVGHLRSTIIGDAAVRLLAWRGHTVIRQNHVGEWGTPFGMLIEHLLDVGEAEAARELSVGDLDGFYKAARREFDSSPEFADRSRRRVVLLQGGDELSLRLWTILVEQSTAYFRAVYAQLGVLLTDADSAGESTYNDRLDEVLAELTAHGLVRVSDGAQCVFPDGFTNRDGDPLPLIVRKGDGGFGYAVTDLAAIRHRLRDLAATRLLYVVGQPQRTHFRMVFRTARDAGWLADPAHAEHVGFGSILGTDGKLLRSRTGDAVKLADLLTEAVTKAGEQVAVKNPALPAAEAAAVARAVGIGAIKYADLSNDRTRDYVFDLPRMLAFEGDTAPYLQYANARIHALLRRAGPGTAAGPVEVVEPAERALVLALLGFPDVVESVERTLEFHRLCGHLLAVATAFTAFYERCPVLRADDERVRASRLALCALTSRALTLGLDLLGIEAPERM